MEADVHNKILEMPRKLVHTMKFVFQVAGLKNLKQAPLVNKPDTLHVDLCTSSSNCSKLIY